MSVARQLRCPECGGPHRHLARTCGYCGTPLTWVGELTLERGECVEAHELGQAPLPEPLSEVQPRPVHGAVELALEPGRLQSGLLATVRRNGCVVLDAVCGDGAGAFGVLWRVSATGGARLGYAISVRPGRRSVQVARLAWSTGTTKQRVLSAWQAHPAIAPIGAVNRLEVRCADAVLQVFVNDERVTTVTDASLGWGRPGWRALAVGGAARIQLQRIGLFDVR